MTKAELVAEMSEKAGISKVKAKEALKALESVISQELRNGGKVQLQGFGSFEVSNREARTAKNPLTGESVSVPSCKVPKFKPGKALKEFIN